VNSGADRIFVDLEILGKVKRQGHLNTLISRHVIADIYSLRAVVPPGRLMVRVNPLNRNSEIEINEVISAGADILMLPMYQTANEVKHFCKLVASRARICLLTETVGAMISLNECVQMPGVDEIHIGLNDLHLELGYNFMFEPLADGFVDRMAQVLRQSGIPFGIGGLARIGEGLIPAELLLSEHVRLGSTAAILSRTFHREHRTVEEINAEMQFGLEITKLRSELTRLCHATSDKLESNRIAIANRIRRIAEA